MDNNRKFGLFWLYNKLRDPKFHSKSSSSSSGLKPRLDSAIQPTAVPFGDHTRSSNPRKSYHFTRELTYIKHEQQKTIGWSNKDHNVEEKSGRYVSSCSLSSSTSTSNATTCSSPLRNQPTRPSHEFRFDRVLTPDSVDKMTSSSSSSTSDIMAVDVMVKEVNPLGLSPISTKNKKKKVVKDATTERRHGSSKRFSLSTSAKSPGMRIRVHSPRLLAATRRMQARRGPVGPRSSCETNRKCGGLAIVKSSFDPWRDFRDSMMEMIVENKIKESEGLEELLVCYLSLNSEVYHDVIISAFKQVWLDLTDIRLNENSSLM